MPDKKIITIFGSSTVLPDSPEYKTAYEVGELLANHGFIVCNGGYGGIMEASAKGAKNSGGKTIGIIIDFFGRTPNDFIDETISENNLLSRLNKLVHLGDAYIIFRGSTGTLAELSIVMEFMIKGLMREKPVIIIGEFWEPVIKLLSTELRDEKSERCAKLVYRVSIPSECIVVLKKFLQS